MTWLNDTCTISNSSRNGPQHNMHYPLLVLKMYLPQMSFWMSLDYISNMQLQLTLCCSLWQCWVITNETIKSIVQVSCLIIYMYSSNIILFTFFGVATSLVWHSPNSQLFWRNWVSLHWRFCLTLVQIMTWCLVASSQYLKQCWVMVNEIPENKSPYISYLTSNHENIFQTLPLGLRIEKCLE